MPKWNVALGNVQSAPHAVSEERGYGRLRRVASGGHLSHGDRGPPGKAAAARPQQGAGSIPARFSLRMAQRARILFFCDE